MRLTYVHPMPAPAPFANTVHVMKMCQAFAANGHDVELVVPQAPRAPAADAFAHYGVRPIFRITRRWWRLPVPGWAWIFAALAVARARGSDVTYTRHLPTAWQSVLLGRPTVFEMHGPPAGLSPFGRRLLRKVASSPHLLRLVVISEALRRMFVEQIGAPGAAAKVLVAHDGADPAPAAPSPAPRGGALQALYAGSFYAGRGIDFLLEVAARAPQVRFAMVGCPPEALQEWRIRAAHLSNVTVGARVSPGEVPALLASADLLLAPYGRQVSTSLDSHDIGSYFSPLKMFEYMASGRPIVATDLPVLREVLEDGRNAVLAPAGDVEAWAQAITALAADPARRRRIGEAARADLEAKYTWKQRAAEVVHGLGVAA